MDKIMSNSLNPVFGQWYTDRQLGNGTDGKVFTIYKEKFDGTRETSILKIIRLGENRNERKTFNLNQDDDDKLSKGFDKIIKSIKKNIDTVKKADNGKHFIKYEDFELRKASDGKGRLILIRLEQAKSLTEVLKGFSFTMEESIRLGINICQALQKCRTFGYIYPNLKPENILFDKEGRCKIGDFGSFSCLEPAKTSISYKRTQYYMAPEFMKSGKINCTCDTYSLGLVLYMLTNRGRLPFTEPYPNNVTINSLNDSMLKRSKGEQLPKPELASEQLWQIIKKACAFKPNERYFTPDQMLADLTNVMNNKPFEEAKFDDVYSVSRDYGEPEKVNVVEPKKNVFLSEAPSKKNVSLKDEIQIPQTVLMDYAPAYNEEKPIANSEKMDKLIDVKPKTGINLRGIKKPIISFLIAVCLIILFVISVMLNVSAKEDYTRSALLIQSNIFQRGDILWQPI